MSESDHGVCELNGGKEGDQENLVEKAGYVFARRRKPPRSCKEARQLISKPASGYFYIQDNNCHEFKVYCDFTSEPGWAWTLDMQNMADTNTHKNGNPTTNTRFTPPESYHNTPGYECLMDIGNGKKKMMVAVIKSEEGSSTTGVRWLAS
ncbi:hypothetical protein pdam_00017973 [Pocillopora damicornis]|uniref:Fibrinogen C-terminal domain-containing protein n=1 Tax=Pocillopora damicornis TaxID=46731 RepID=A0A3M6UY70_POCDA|nr:hypothetical protein pdam_00017973 [Pocillopora damicornis]